jgi:anti-sigma factor RsiW
MAAPIDRTMSDDALLTAYSDGELTADERSALERRLSSDPALAARLEELRRGGRDFAGAYDTLLAEAPHGRLSSILAEAAEKARPPEHRPQRWRLGAIAAAIAVFVLGAAAGYLVPLATGGLRPVEVAEAPNWRQAVAEYMGFTTPETLAIIRDRPAELADEVSAVGQKVSLDLAPDRLALPDATLKRASLYDFHGKPLAQLAYLSPSDGAFAFCIIANGKPDAAVAHEQREGFNIVFWNRNGLGYMLIGKAPRAALEAFAGDLRAKVT